MQQKNKYYKKYKSFILKNEYKILQRKSFNKQKNN